MQVKGFVQRKLLFQSDSAVAIWVRRFRLFHLSNLNHRHQRYTTESCILYLYRNPTPYPLPRISHLVPCISHVAPRTSHLVPRTSHLATRTSLLVSRTSFLAPRIYHLVHRASNSFLVPGKYPLTDVAGTNYKNSVHCKKIVHIIFELKS